MDHKKNYTQKENEDKIPEWLESMSTASWRKSVILILSMFIALGSWVMLQVAAFPTEYTSRYEFQCAVDRLERVLESGFARQTDQIIDLYKKDRR